MVHDCTAGKVDAHGNVSTVPLTSDHTPMDAQEAARINATGVSAAVLPFVSNYLRITPVQTSLVCASLTQFRSVFYVASTVHAIYPGSISCYRLSHGRVNS